MFFIFIVTIIKNEKAFAQKPPEIAYDPAKQIYNADSAITPLSPTNTGGSVYPANYNKPVTFVAGTAPFCIALDGSNNVYTTNNITGYLTKYNQAGTVLFTVNTGDPMASEVAVDGLGNIYVSQFAANSVLKYSANGALLATIPGFSDPYGIAFDASNNAYIANRFTGNILEIKAGATSSSIYLTGFNTPYGIIIDALGNMYVGEQSTGNIIKVAAGTLTRTTFASGLNGPRHLNKDAFDNIYVADYGNNAIKRISPAGKITTVLSTGLTFPRQAAFDSSGNLFIANYGTNTLLKSNATAYSIDATLPTGLKFNTLTGQITGTPTMPEAAATFTITAYNTGGSSSTPLDISVIAATKDITSKQSTQKTGNLDLGADKIVVHPAVSPNGDGINDFLLIEGLENYPENKVTVVDRNGVAVYITSGYNNSNKVFDGRSNINGRLEQPGTYFYIIEYTKNGEARRKTGYFVMKFK